MVKASHCESGDMGLNPAGTETCALYFPPLKFRLWRYCADKVLDLHTNILLPLFWSTLESCQGHRLSHMCWPGAWAVNIGIV